MIGQPYAEDVDLEVARAHWEADGLIIDVRTPGEYAAGHVAGAVNVPLDTLAFRLDDLPSGQVLTVCSMGTRSRQGAERLARLGRTALSLRGGTKAWTAAGLPVVRGPEPDSRSHRSRPGPLRLLLQGLRRGRRSPQG